MACSPCAKMRQNLRTSLASGNLGGAARIAAAGAAAMAGLRDKNDALVESEKIVATSAADAPNVKRYGG